MKREKVKENICSAAKVGQKHNLKLVRVKSQ